MMYHDHVSDTFAWRGLRNNICVAWFIESGSVELRLQNRILSAEAGQWVFQSPGLHLDQVFEPNTKLISIRYDFRWQNGQHVFHDGNAASLYGTHHPHLQTSALELLAHHTRATDSNNGSETMESILRGQELLCRWLQQSYAAMSHLGFVASQESPSDSRCTLVLEILKDSLHLCDVPYALICSRTQLSRVHLNRIFIKEFAYSPKQQHDTLRIEHARSLLENHSLPIKNICRQLGFSDNSQFTKWFRRLDGQTPSVARKNIGHWA